MSRFKYGPNGRTFDLTITQVKRWHQYVYDRRLCAPGCVFCFVVGERGNLEEVAEHLACAFSIVRVMPSFIVVQVDGVPTTTPGGLESCTGADQLYQVVSGRVLVGELRPALADVWPDDQFGPAREETERGPSLTQAPDDLM